MDFTHVFIVDLFPHKTQHFPTISKQGKNRNDGKETELNLSLKNVPNSNPYVFPNSVSQNVLLSHIKYILSACLFMRI